MFLLMARTAPKLNCLRFLPHTESVLIFTWDFSTLPRFQSPFLTKTAIFLATYLHQPMTALPGRPSFSITAVMQRAHFSGQVSVNLLWIEVTTASSSMDRVNKACCSSETFRFDR